MKYEYGIGPNGESLLPEIMDGNFVSVTAVPSADKPQGYEVRLDTGVVLLLPPVAYGSITGLESGDYFQIVPMKNKIDGVEKVFNNAKRVFVLRNNVEDRRFGITNNWIILE